MPMTAQRRYDLLINESEAVRFDYCKLRMSEVAEYRGKSRTRMELRDQRHRRQSREGSDENGAAGTRAT